MVYFLIILLTVYYEHPVLVIMVRLCSKAHGTFCMCWEHTMYKLSASWLAHLKNIKYCTLHQPRIQHCPKCALVWYGRCLTWHQPLTHSENPPKNHWHTRAQNSTVFNWFTFNLWSDSRDHENHKTQWNAPISDKKPQNHLN